MSDFQRVNYWGKAMSRDKKTTKNESTHEYKKGLHYLNKKYAFICFIY